MRPLALALSILFAAAVPSAQDAPTGNTGVAAERPLALPVLRANQACPVTIGTSYGPPPPHVFGGPFWFGDGPVYVNFAWGDGDRAGFSLSLVPIEHGAHRAKTPWVVDPSYSGPIQVRGRSLGADSMMLLFRSSMFDMPAERLLLRAPNAPSPGQLSFWPSGMFVPGPGCYGLQIDTVGRTQVVVFEAR